MTKSPAGLDATWAQNSVSPRPCQIQEFDVNLFFEMSGKLGPDDASNQTCPNSATATLAGHKRIKLKIDLFILLFHIYYKFN